VGGLEGKIARISRAFFIRTMRCFIFSVKTILVKNRSGLGFGGRAVTTVHITAKNKHFILWAVYIKSND